jgi:hypothetical protein
VARAKPSESITTRTEGKKADTSPSASSKPEESPESTPKPVVGSGWILVATLWVLLFAVLVLYEGYGFLKGVLRF